MFIVVAYGMPYSTREMPPDNRQMRRYDIVTRTWEDNHAFDAESHYRYEVTDVPELTPLQRFLSRTCYNPNVASKAKWTRVGDFDADALIAAVRKGLEHDDDIIQQWFCADEVLQLLSSATSWNETLLAVEAIGGGHEVMPEVDAYANRVLAGADHHCP